jgi:predicted  nucleic acid-binding Zn-ribbon protein
MNERSKKLKELLQEKEKWENEIARIRTEEQKRREWYDSLAPDQKTKASMSGLALDRSLTDVQPFQDRIQKVNNELMVIFTESIETHSRRLSRLTVVLICLTVVLAFLTADLIWRFPI